MNIKIPDKLKEQVAAILGKIDPKNYFYIFVGILLFLFLIDYFILMRPQIAALSKISGENKKLSDDIKQLKEDEKNLSGYRNQIEQLTNKVEEADLRFRSKNELDYVIQEISRLANLNKVKIDEIMSENENIKEVMKNIKRSYYSLPIDIEGKSDYHNLGRFLNQLETDNVFLNIRAFSLSKTEDAHSHKIKLTIKTIVYDEK